VSDANKSVRHRKNITPRYFVPITYRCTKKAPDLPRYRSMSTDVRQAIRRFCRKIHRKYIVT